MLDVGDQQQGIEMPQNFVRSPVLCELNDGSGQVAVVLFEFGFEAREEREGVGGGTRESRDDTVLVKAAEFLRGAFEDFRSDGDLTVTSHHYFAVSADTQDRRGANAAPAEAAVVRIVH